MDLLVPQVRTLQPSIPTTEQHRSCLQNWKSQVTLHCTTVWELLKSRHRSIQRQVLQCYEGTLQQNNHQKTFTRLSLSHHLVPLSVFSFGFMTGSTELPAEWTLLKLGGLQARLTLYCKDQMLKWQRKEGFALFTACACCGPDALAHSGDLLARRSATARACGSCSSDSSSCTSLNGRSAPGIGCGNARSSCCGISGACVSSICSLLISCSFSPSSLCSWNCG